MIKEDNLGDTNKLSGQTMKWSLPSENCRMGWKAGSFYRIKNKRTRESKVSIMVEWDVSFVPPFQSTTSKTSTTRQRRLCPTHQDAREFHISVHLKMGGTERGDKTRGTVEAVPAILVPWPWQLSLKTQRTRDQQERRCTQLQPHDGCLQWWHPGTQ